MKTNSNLQDLHAAFASLPPKVKEWLSSEEATYIVGEITYRLGLTQEKVPIIPGLIFRLVTNDVEPLNFMNELAIELGVNFQTAKTIAEDIEKKILRPIERELREATGLDAKTIYFGRPEGAPTAAQTAIPTAAQPQQEPKPTPTLRQITPPTTPSLPPQEKQLTQPTPPIQRPSGPTVNVTSFESETINPFMLHKEESFSAPSAEEFAKRSINLNIKIPESKKPEVKAIPVRLEAPESPSPAAPKPAAPTTPAAPAKPQIPESTTKPQVPSAPISYSTKAPQTTDKNLLPMNPDDAKVRVVHYSGYRTPLNPLGKPKVPEENTIDLRSITNNQRPATSNE